MANANAQTHDIDLASPNLNLDKYKLGVSQFDGFNYRNSPFISHEIKNLYTNTKSAGVFIDEDNNEYKLEGHNFKKNGQTIRTFKQKSFLNIEKINGIAQNDIRIFTGLSNNRKIGYKSDGIYTFVIGLSEPVKHNPLSGYSILRILDASIKKTSDEIWVLSLQKHDSTTAIVISLLDRFGAGESKLLTTNYNQNAEYILCVSNAYENYAGWYPRIQYKINPCCCVFCNISGEHNCYVTQENNSFVVFVQNDVLYVKSLTDSYLYYDIDTNQGDSIGFKSKSKLCNKSAFMAIDGINAYNTQATQSGFSIRNSFFYFTNAYVYEDNVGTEENPEYVEKFYVSLKSDNLWVNVHPGIDYRDLAPTNTSTSNYCSTYNKYHTNISYLGGTVNGKEYYISLNSHNYISSSYFPTLNTNTIGGGVNIFTVDDSSNDNRKTALGFRLLFSNDSISGISIIEGLRTQGSIIFPLYSISDIIDVVVLQSDIIIIVRINNDIYSLQFVTISEEEYNYYRVLNNRYFIFYNAEYYNAYDLVTDTWFHCANDFNFTQRNLTLSGVTGHTYYKQFVVAASVGAFYEQDKNPFPSQQRNSVIVNQIFARVVSGIPYIDFAYTDYIAPLGVNYKPFGTDYFLKEPQSGDSIETVVPQYKFTITQRADWKILFNQNDNYPNTEGNLLLPIPIYVKSDNLQVPMIYNEDIGFNAPIHIQNGSPTGLYFLLAAQIDAEYYFTIQTQLYCIIDDWICSYIYKDGIADNIKRVANVYGLDFLCATPISAFFWSRYNKTIYQFQGDALLHRGQCIDEIEHIYQVKYNSATNDIIMCCDAYTIILSEQYAFKVANETKTVSGQTVEIPYTDVFWTNTDLCLRNTDHILMIRYNAAQLPYRKQNIIVKTQLYGLGDNMLSETDCVYIRVFNAENETGVQTVKVGGFTLTDKKTLLEDNPATGNMKVFTINPSDWTDDGSYYIRYQPTYQKALGIQIEIDSTVPITYIGVSNIPDTKMITKL